MIRIERITGDNAGLLANIAGDVFDGPIQAERLSAVIASEMHLLLVAVEDDLVVGQCQAMILLGPDRPPALYVENLGVTPDFRRQGIARELMMRAFGIGKQAGCDRGWLGVEPDSEAARPFYASLGLNFETVEFADFALS